MKICELKQKEVINICTCRSLGCPIDAEFDCKSSQLTALILPGPGRFCCLFGRDNEYIIPWECISQIGDDIILVKIDEDKAEKILENQSIIKVPVVRNGKQATVGYQPEIWKSWK